jgi:MoaA/NifB/PqqE/SkfB family radical SAM enzyme
MTSPRRPHQRVRATSSTALSHPGRTAALALPRVICFRVTRLCNARCGFCLAPPDGNHPRQETLTHRIDWLLDRGVETIHFCGGEPTIVPWLPQIITHVHARRGSTKLTTNGILLPDPLLSVLRDSPTATKVSVHGDREHHDRVVGRDAFEATTANLRRMVAAGIRVSVQTTLVAGGESVIDWVIGFCLEVGVRRLSFLPFIPRGNGYLRRGDYEFSSAQRNALRALVREKRRALSSRLDVRWLDFTARPIPVVEADGRVILEGPTESRDTVLCRIADPEPS